MATASGPKAARPADATVSAPGRHTPAQKVTPVPVPKLGTVPSLPPSANQAAAVGRTSNAANNSATATAVQGSFGLLTPAESNLQDAANGPHRDGRIRNPVPSKLKGKTDGSKGNFSVMHMGVAGRAEPTERDAQAKRTSESTELAAKRAFENGYVSHRRSKFVQLPDETAAKPFVPATISAQVPSYMSSRQTPLNADETKSEQARLLTLLRSLQPLLVVDQICKALAFFGGIPGAPPPADGEFPQSAEANGSGSLFVGWIAEIFPKLGGNNGQQNMAPVRQMDGPEPVRRKRGRPKGSKATKVRKDKGLKKGSSTDMPDTDRPHRKVGADGNWVDVEYGDTSAPDMVDANVMLLAQAASPHREPAHVEAPGITQPDGATSHVAATIPARTMQHHGPGNDSLVIESPGNMKKRGRPKGSRNRPKVADAAVLPRQSVQPADNSYTSAQLSQTMEGSQPQPANASFTAVNSVTSANSAKKKGPRPKASVTKKQVDAPVKTDNSGPNELQTTVPSASIQQQTVELNGNPTQKQAQQNVHSDQASHVIPIGMVPAPTTIDSARVPVNAGQKRKRKTAKDAGVIDTINGIGSTTPSSSAVPLPTPSTQPGSQSMTATTAVGIPPAKRQRKSKESRPKGKKSNGMTIPDSIEPASSSQMKPATPAPVPSPNQAPATTPAPFHTAAGIGSEVTPVSSSVSLEQVMPLAHSPQGHFDVQSPTMENYEAQLQAQLELKSDIESQHHSLTPRPIVTNHLQQQQSQRRQQRQPPTQQQPRQSSQPHAQHSMSQPQPHPQPESSVQQPQPQRPQSISQQPSQHQTSVSQPSTQGQVQAHQSQTSSPMISQQQNRANHHYTQYRPSTSPYNQGQHQHSYSSPQQQSQNFTEQQQAQATPQPTPAQQYSNTHQLPPYGSSQQSYQNSHSHYNGTQQSVASQQRYQQHLATGITTASAYSAHQSPQFGASSTNTFSSTDTGYRGSTGSTSNPTYGSQQGQSSAPTAASTYRTSSTHNMVHQSPSYTTNTGTALHRSSSTSHPASQGIQAISNMQSFAGTNNTEWDFLNPGTLDSAGSQGALAMGGAGYAMNTASVRSTSNSGTPFTASTMANFDASGLPSLGGNNRYFELGRR
ncbi:hypothetical protein QBC32DRAFT_318751 [Pseudoneurospora amorphoporcata]|uniref:Uncharacterized protein n=1 Tax=Pseudoneurospora amorphoporcata TaxID=241081 RepID=A0AAN6SAX3_9PEZI|nr:hypothetical protein QBC32DRAFT_318751 [Pseudoneurospora amorphoporcata]